MIQKSVWLIVAECLCLTLSVFRIYYEDITQRRNVVYIPMSFDDSTFDLYPNYGIAWTLLNYTRRYTSTSRSGLLYMYVQGACTIGRCTAREMTHLLDMVRAQVTQRNLVVEGLQPVGCQYNGAEKKIYLFIYLFTARVFVKLQLNFDAKGDDAVERKRKDIQWCSGNHSSIHK